MITTKTDSQVLAALAGLSQLTPLIRALQGGGISFAPDAPLNDNEIVIGQLTETEQALFSACRILEVRAGNIAQTHSDLQMRLWQQNPTNDDSNAILELSLQQSDYEATTALTKALAKVMWHAIRERIGAPAFEYTRYGLRSNGQIVSYGALMSGAELLMGDNTGIGFGLHVLFIG